MNFKKIIYRFVILCSFAFVYANEAKAQGNLQFNQVKLVSTSDTVPANKVWKVESVLYSSEHYNNSTINLNGQVVYVRTYAVSNGQSVWEMSFPFWVPEGTILSVGANVRKISIIEYNIIP
jgi:hypothetical protein